MKVEPWVSAPSSHFWASSAHTAARRGSLSHHLSSQVRDLVHMPVNAEARPGQDPPRYGDFSFNCRNQELPKMSLCSQKRIR